MIDLWSSLGFVALRFGWFLACYGRIVELLNKASKRTFCLIGYEALCRLV